jgi:hypothetical protein
MPAPSLETPDDAPLRQRPAETTAREPELRQSTREHGQTDGDASPQSSTTELQDADHALGGLDDLPPESAVPSWAPSAMMLVGVAMLTWLMLRSFVRRAKQPTEPSDPRARLQAIRKQADARAQIESYSADAQELAQRLAAQLDAKAHRIQILLEEADEAVRRLERARRGLDARGDIRIEGRADRPRHLAHDAPSPDDNPLAGEVYRLADEGHSTLEIAQRLKQHVGQIELMLALRRA